MRDKVYNAIVEYIERNGYPPTYREIGEMTGLKSTSTIFFHVEKLADEGKIEVRGRRESRAIRVIGYKFVREEQCDGDTSGYPAEAEPS